RVVDEADGTLVGRTPYVVSHVQADSALSLRLEMDGFEPRQVAVPLSSNFDGTYALEKKAAAPEPAPAPRAKSHRPGPAAASPGARPAHKRGAPEIEWE